MLYLKSKVGRKFNQTKKYQKKYLIIKTTSIYGYGLGKDKFLKKY